MQIGWWRDLWGLFVAWVMSRCGYEYHLATTKDDPVDEWRRKV